MAGPAPRVLAAARSPRPLVLTGRPELLDDLLRIAAGVHVLVDVAPDPVAGKAWYSSAPLVLLGIDLAPACVRSGFHRRPGVILVGRHSAERPPSWPVAEEIGAEHIAALPAAEPWLAERLGGTVTRDPRPVRAPVGPGRVVAVLGGRGGAGASVLAASLGLVASRRGLRTLLIDADPLGGGLDLVLGWESLDGLRWPAIASASGRVNPPTLVAELPGRGELVALSWDRGEVVASPAEAMATALDAGRRGRDLVVVDLPRRLDEASVLALAEADRAFLVVPAELRACAAARRVATAVAEHCRALSLVVRGPAPGGLKARDVAAALDLPLAGQVRAEPGLARALERGLQPAGDGRSPLVGLCDRLLDGLVGAGS